MGTHSFGYIAVIVLQQLTIVGLLWGMVLLLREVERLRRGFKIRTALENVDLHPAGQKLARPQFQELRAGPAVELALEHAMKRVACVLTGLTS
jgi:hypothetical protein